VGRLLIVVEHELPADRADLRGMSYAKAPARDIHFVNSLVAEVAVAGIPEPVPVVVEAVLGERTLRRRTGPKIVIHAGRHFGDRSLADGVARLETQSARHVDLAEFTVRQLLHAFFQGLGGTALAAH